MPPAISTRKALAVCACFGAVYLLYLPHALPVLDDWTYLLIFHRARAGGIGGAPAFLRHLIDNSWMGQFRIFWASFVPVFALSFGADFTAWPYFLLGWTAHLLTAVLLWRTVSLLAGDRAAGFAAGTIYAVFPAANNVLFWPVNSCFYFLQALVFAWWFIYTWKKLAAVGDGRYRWKDLAILLPVVFSGEQILPALVLLLPVTHWLFGEQGKRRAFWRFWVRHVAAVGVLLGLYAVVVNRMPIVRGFDARYGGGRHWSPWPFPQRLLASLGLNPVFAEWRPAWGVDAALVGLMVLAGAAFFWGLRLCAGWPAASPSAPVQQGKLLLWSIAGVALTCLPVVFLPGIEWRYLYVPAAFLVSAGVALLGLLGRWARLVLAFLVVAYGISLTYFEMRQCWIPQSREARALLEAVATAGPVHAREVLIFSHAPHAMGTAPSFILGASWSLNNMLEHYTGAEQVQGARELLVNERGDLALYRRDSLARFTPHDIPRLRVFVRDAGGRFLPRSLLALPAPDRRFQLFPLRPFQGTVRVPARPLTLEELKGLPVFGDIYFAHPFSGPLNAPES